METSNLDTSGKRPSTSGWILASTAGLIVVILSYSVLLFASDTRKIYLYEKIHSSLESGDYISAEQHVKSLHSKLTVMRWLEALKLKSVDRASKYDEEGNTRAVLKISRAIAEEDYTGARVLFKDLNLFQIEHLLNYKGSETTAKELIQALDYRLDEYEDHLERFRQTEQLIEDLESKRDSLFDRFDLIAEDFGDFFSLAADPGEEYEGDGFYLYENGVLAGLPRLKRLRDDIVDAPTLKKTLRSVGGRVNIKGANPAQQFSGKLEKIRQAVNALSAELDGLDAKLDLLDQRYEREGAELDGARDLAGKKFGTMLLSIARPKTSAVSVKLWPFLNLSD